MLLTAGLYTLGAVLASLGALYRSASGRTSTWHNLAALSLAGASSFFLLVPVDLPFRRAMVFYVMALTQTLTLSCVLLQIRKPNLEANATFVAFGAALGSVLLLLVNGILLPRFRGVLTNPDILLHTLIWSSLAVVALGQLLIRRVLPLTPDVQAVYAQRFWSVVGKVAILQGINYALFIGLTTLLKTEPKVAAKVGAVIGLLNIKAITIFRGWIVKSAARIAPERDAAPIVEKQQASLISPTASQAPQAQKLGHP